SVATERRALSAAALPAERDRAVFEALLARADVLVENFRPGTLARLGYGGGGVGGRLCRGVPRRPAGRVDAGIVQGMGGSMSLPAQPGGPPTRVGTSIGDIAAGLFAAIGIGAAL